MNELLRDAAARASAYLDGLATQVVAEAAPFAGVRRQEAAQHPDRRRLAAAVRAEEAEDDAARHGDREVVDDGTAVVALREAAHVDRDVAAGRCQRQRAPLASATSTGNPGCSAGFGASGHASTRNTRFARFSRL